METKKTSKPQYKFIAYKGFDKDFKCRGFQYEVGGEYTHEGDVVICRGGFHACEHPLEVFGHYSPARSRFAVVAQSGELRRDGTKVVSRHITVKAEIDVAGLVKAAIENAKARSGPIYPDSSASATGDYGAASATNFRGVAFATGRYGAASATGICGAASATGYQGAAFATGYRSAASATGYHGAASATGDHGVATAAGIACKAKGAEGCALFLVYRHYDCRILHAKAVIVGQDGVLPDTWYRLNENGELETAESP